MADTNKPAQAGGAPARQAPLEVRLATMVSRMKKAGRLDEGEARCRQLLAERPQQPGVLHLLGLILEEKGDRSGAIALLEQAAAAAPKTPVHLVTLCRLYRRENRTEDDLRSARLAVSLAPRYLRARIEHAFASFFAGDMDEAKNQFMESLRIDPASVAGHAGLAQALLLTGEYRAGWREFQWFQKVPEFAAKLPKFRIPEWNGMRLPGKRILLFGDQGFGDNIQFARYIPMVAERCGEVLLWCYDHLNGLFSRIEGVAQCSARVRDLPAAHCYCLLSSLPRMFATELDSIPSAVPYLGAEPGVVQRWSERLDAAAHSSGLRVGIAWAGKQTHGRDNQRSLSLSQLNPVLSVRGICPVSLQKVARAEDAGADVSVRPMDFSSEMENFAETAALIQNLDLVITIDSSMAHLAGALGKPAWVMLPYIPDWRWCRDRDDSPWYPTARLFRQDASRSWDQVIERVAGELPSMVRNSARRGRSKAG